MQSAFSKLLIVQMKSLLLVIVYILMAAAECSTVGSDLRALSHRFKEREGLYLNLGASSQCRGTVTAWHFCYGMSECETDVKYHATFLVYRPINRNYTSSELSIVPESIKSTSLGCQNRSKVKCGKEMLLSSEQFMVQENDVVAVCLPAEREKRLQLISRKYDEDEGTEGTLYQHYSEIEGCDRNKLRTVNMQGITPHTYLQLHLHAEVAASKRHMTTHTNPDYSLRFNDRREQWYLKVIPASIAGLAILVVFVVIVLGIALKCRQMLVGSRSPSNTIAACNPIAAAAHVPQATTAMNDYTLDDNVAYSIPITSARRTPQLQDEHIYEIV